MLAGLEGKAFVCFTFGTATIFVVFRAGFFIFTIAGFFIFVLKTARLEKKRK